MKMTDEQRREKKVEVEMLTEKIEVLTESLELTTDSRKALITELFLDQYGIKKDEPFYYESRPVVFKTIELSPLKPEVSFVYMIPFKKDGSLAKYEIKAHIIAFATFLETPQL